MIGERIFGGVAGGEQEFRWRGGAVSRLEGLSDAVFALALTLLIVSLEVPRTFDELRAAFEQLPVFAACFTILALCWFHQFRFHRRYGLEDVTTIVLDLALLFVILLYVYPLKFLCRFLWLLASGRSQLATGGDHPMLHDTHDIQQLMVIYGLGYTAVYALLAALYWRAWSLRLVLELDSAERVITKSALHAHLASAAIGVLSVAIALARPSFAGWAGMTYFLLGPMHWIHGVLTGRALARYRGKIPGAPMPT
jgi:uncharacterized membrane protein